MSYLSGVNPNHRNYFLCDKKEEVVDVVPVVVEAEVVVDGVVPIVVNDESVVPTQTELFVLSKGEQVGLLKRLGCSDGEITVLRTEKRRVAKLLELFGGRKK